MEQKSIKIERVFTKNDWDHLHDVVVNATDKNLNRDELENVFKELPHSIRLIAMEWGMNDTVFRDNVYKWLDKQNKTL